MYVERPIIPRTASSMEMGMKNGTIRIVIDTTTLKYVCCMRAATAIASISARGVWPEARGDQKECLSSSH
jgi:hypothetical protein